MEKLILASGSPRRKELLAYMGIPFSIVVSNGEEKADADDPEQIVEKLSRAQAGNVAQMLKNEKEPCLILGADTVVAFNGKILGKPRDKKDARKTLMSLQGNTHQVFTGVTILHKKEKKWETVTFCEKTDVHFYPVSEEEIWEYVESGEPMDKAGSYGIQGRFGIYVKNICGDYNNVVGLPVGRLVYELKKMGIDRKELTND